MQHFFIENRICESRRLSPQRIIFLAFSDQDEADSLLGEMLFVLQPAI
jgi:hypothetical protein